jgi:hypothetical protein
MTDLDRDELGRLQYGDNGDAIPAMTMVDESIDLLDEDRLAFDRMVARDIPMIDAVQALDCVLKGKEDGYPRDFPFPTSVAAIEAYVEYRKSLGEVCPDTTILSDVERRRGRLQETVFAVHSRDEQNASEDFAGASSIGV